MANVCPIDKTLTAFSKIERRDKNRRFGMKYTLGWQKQIAHFWRRWDSLSNDLPATDQHITFVYVVMGGPT